MKKALYIAYGSNMDTDQMAYRCPTAELIGKAELDGWQLLFKGSQTGAYATVEKAVGYTVPVLVWEIGPIDEARLDRYEGFPYFYYKKTVTVTLDGMPRRGMVYIMHENRQLGEPSYQYYRMLEDAYYRFDFDLSILEKALENTISGEDDEDESDDERKTGHYTPPDGGAPA